MGCFDYTLTQYSLNCIVSFRSICGLAGSKPESCHLLADDNGDFDVGVAHELEGALDGRQLQVQHLAAAAAAVGQRASGGLGFRGLRFAGLGMPRLGFRESGLR